MRQFLLGLSFSVVFGAGCATGALHQARIAFADRPPPADIIRWEVKCFDSDLMGVNQWWPNEELDKPDGWNRALARLGAQGWEPVQFMDGSAKPGTVRMSIPGTIGAVCCKRPLALQAPAPVTLTSAVPTASSAAAPR